MTPILFQSTRPHGARHEVRTITSHLKQVSIHAPARGATRSQTLGNPELRRFNPRARTGRDVVEQAFGEAYEAFQSTRPHGARHPVVAKKFAAFMVSIHAPARGATSGNASPKDWLWSFNPRARTGRD